MDRLAAIRNNIGDVHAVLKLHTIVLDLVNVVNAVLSDNSVLKCKIGDIWLNSCSKANAVDHLNVISNFPSVSNFASNHVFCTPDTEVRYTSKSSSNKEFEVRDTRRLRVLLLILRGCLRVLLLIRGRPRVSLLIHPRLLIFSSSTCITLLLAYVLSMS